MVDVDSALLNVQERDNWRRRMEALERSLGEVREHRRRVEGRLRRVRRDLARLRDRGEATLRTLERPETAGVVNAPANAPFHNR